MAVGAALVLPLPALVLPFWRDDFIHQLAIKAWLGEEIPPGYLVKHYVDPFGFLSLFDFVRSAWINELVAHGDIPWWVSSDLHMAFWRPLSSLTHLLDYLAFGSRPAFHRLHSILWYGLFTAAVGLLYRRQLSVALFPLALFLFVIEEAHWGPACFIANRHALIGGALGVLALLSHIRRRERESGWGGALSLLLFALALLGGEAALGTFAYLAAYELFSDRRSIARRFLPLLPPAVLVLSWFLFYRLAGYGARGIDLYIDPMQAPPRYLSVAFERFFVLLSSQLAGVIAELSLGSPELKGLQVALGITATALISWLLRGLWPVLDASDRRALRWMMPGALLSLLPVISTYPMDRLLLLPGIGGAVVVAITIRHVWGRLRAWRTIAGSQRVLPVVLSPMLLTHIAVPLVVWLGIPAVMHAYHERLAHELSPAAFQRDDLESCRAFIIGAPDLLEVMVLPARRILSGKRNPDKEYILSSSVRPQRLRRTGDRALVLESVEGGLLHSVLFKLVPPPHARYRAGDTVRLSGLRIRILERDGRGLKRIAFEFADSLDDDHTLLLVWGAKGLERLHPPPVGQSVFLPRDAIDLVTDNPDPLHGSRPLPPGPDR